MTFYIIIFVLIAFLALIDFCANRKVRYGVNDKFGVFIFLLLGLFAGSRYKIGGSDYDAYDAYYNMTPSDINLIFHKDYDVFLSSIEEGYLYLMALFKLINLNFNEFLIIVGISCSMLIFFSFKKFTVYTYVSTLVFLSKGYLYYFFTAQRQIIAMVLCWISIKYIYEKKFSKFLFLTLLASLFHSSALFFILVFFFGRMQLSNIRIFLLLVASIIFQLFYVGPILSLAVSNFLPMGGEKLLTYLKGDSSRVNILNYFELFPVYFVVSFYKDRIMCNWKYFNVLFNMFILYFALTIVFYDFSFISRLKGYLVIGYISMFASIITIPKSRINGLILLLLLITYSLVVYIRELVTFDGGFGYLPYSSYFFQ